MGFMTNSSTNLVIKITIGLSIAFWISGLTPILAYDATENANYITPPLKLKTDLVVLEGKMEGKGYKITPEVINDGYSNTYTLETEFGEVKAVSDYQLARQIQEIRALIILDEMSRAGVFGDAMKEGVMAPIHGAKALVTEPVDTTKGAVKGVGRWLGNIGRAVSSDDPYQEGGASAAVGWAGTKRAFALELGVDPYTDWEPLQKGLTSVARAAFSGGVTVGVAMDALTEGTMVGTIITVNSLTKEMNDILLDNPPEGLTKINREKLVNMGVSENVVFCKKVDSRHGWPRGANMSQRTHDVVRLTH